jgi:hypothetical protein
MFILIFLLIVLILLSYINTNEGFTEISNDAYVINLDSRPDRMEKIITRFSSLNIIRVDAIKDNIGWKGCAKSHIKIVQMAKDMNLPFILIMEDDAIPTDSFSNWPKIKTWLEKNKEKWDIYLGGNTHYAYNKESPIDPICTLESIKLYKTKLQTLHFYYINSTAYDAFLKYDFIKPIDLWPDLQHMRTISSIPFISIQDTTYSDIEKRDVNYDDMFNLSETAIGIIDNVKECFKNQHQY